MKNGKRSIALIAGFFFIQFAVNGLEVSTPIHFNTPEMKIKGGKVLAVSSRELAVEFQPLSKQVVIELPLNGFDAMSCDRIQTEITTSKNFSKVSFSCLDLQKKMPYLTRHVWPGKGTEIVSGFFPDVGFEKKLGLLKIQIRDFSEQKGNLSKPVPGRTVLFKNFSFVSDDSLLPERLTPFVYRGTVPLDKETRNRLALLQKEYSSARAALLQAKDDSRRLDLLKNLQRKRLQGAYSCEKMLLSRLAANGRVTYACGNGVDKIFRKRAFPGAIEGKAVVKLAGNESEAAQVAVYAARPLNNISVQCSPLVMTDGNGKKEVLSSVTAFPVGYVKRPVVPTYYRASDPWFPDPILNDLTRFQVEAGHWQPVWVEVKSEKNQKAGLYRGTIRFCENGKEILRVPLEVTVWNFTLPTGNTFPTAISSGFSWNENSAVAKFYCNDRKTRHEAYQWLRDENPETYQKLSPEARRLAGIVKKCLNAFETHRVPDDSLYHDLWNEVPAKYRKKYAAAKTTFNLGNPYGGRSDLTYLRKRVAEARADGSFPYAYVYGFDEIKTWNEFREMSHTFEAFKKEFPDLKTMTSSWDYTLGDAFDAWKYTDIWILSTSVYLSRPAAVERARKRGQTVWWYTCDYPQPPSANIILENTGVATRALMGFMPWKFGAQGYIFYATASWSDREPTDCLLFRWKGIPRKQVVQTGPDLDGEPWFQEYEMTATEAQPSVKLLAQWRKLAQKKPSSGITLRADVKWMRYQPSSDSKVEVTASIKYTNGKSETIRLVPDANAKDWVHLEKTIRPSAPIASFTAGVFLTGKSNRIRVKNVCFSAAGETAKRLVHLTEPYADGVLAGIRYPGYEASGCGSWILPGKDGPVCTIRLKNYRDGLDDYEYLTLLKKTLEKVLAQKNVSDAARNWIREAQTALRVNDVVCRDVDRYTEQGGVLLNAREKIADLLCRAPVPVEVVNQ